MYAGIDPKVKKPKSIKPSTPPRPALPLAPGIQTYIIANPKDARIKFGRSKNVQKRLRGLEHHVGTKLILIAVMDGNFQFAFHAKFNRARVAGEWFDARDSSLAEYLLNEHGYNQIKMTEAIQNYEQQIIREPRVIVKAPLKIIDGPRCASTQHNE